MPQNLDPRLSLLYQMTPCCKLAADIGTDHGYLICALVESGRAERGIAADINEKPLDKARREARGRGLEDRMDFYQTDGLTGIPPDGLETVIIAGMGGETIAHILESWPYRENGGITWLLQPMTKAERLRRWLWENGFSITRERCREAAGKVYSVMEVRYTGELLTRQDWEYYLGAIDPGEDEDARRYARSKAAELEKIAAGLESGGNPEGRKKGTRLRRIAGAIRQKIQEGE